MNLISRIEIHFNERKGTILTYNEILSRALNLLIKEENMMVAVSKETLNRFESMKKGMVYKNAI